MLTIRNSDNTVQIGDDFANYRLVRSYVVATSSFSDSVSVPFGPIIPPEANINVDGIESPLVVIRPYNDSRLGAISVWWRAGVAKLLGKQKNMLYQVEVFIFGKTTRAATGNEPKLLMRDASGVVAYDSRHIPLVVEDFVVVTSGVSGNDEVNLGSFLPGKGLGICMVGPRTTYKNVNQQVAYVEIEALRVTTANNIYTSAIRLWDTNNGAYFQSASFDMTDNPFYMMLVDVNKLPLPYENV